MKKFLLWSLLSILCLSNLVVFWATSNATLSKKIDQQNQKIEIIFNELSWFKSDFSKFKGDYISIDNKMFEYYKKVVDWWDNTIANSLTTQWIILALFAVAIAVLGWILSRNIDRKYDKIEKIGIKTKWILTEANKIKTRSDDNSKMLYNQVLEQEAEYIFDRLREYPEDVNNFFQTLATRNYLNEKYFKKFLELYRIIWDEYKSSYLTLIYQHFPDKLLISSDDDIWQWFISNFDEILYRSYTKERRQCTEKIVYTLTKNDMGIYKNRFSEYIMNLSKTKYLEKNDNELLKIIVNTFKINNKEDVLEEVCNNISLDYKTIIDGKTS